MLTIVATEKYSKLSCGVVPEDRRLQVSGVGVTFAVLGVLTFGLRIFSKVKTDAGTLGFDDLVMGFVAVGFSSSPIHLCISLITIRWS